MVRLWRVVSGRWRGVFARRDHGGCQSHRFSAPESGLEEARTEEVVLGAETALGLQRAMLRVGPLRLGDEGSRGSSHLQRIAAAEREAKAVRDGMHPGGEIVFRTGGCDGDAMIAAVIHVWSHQ